MAILFAYKLYVSEGKLMKIYEFNAQSIDGKDVSLGEYKGKTLLIVNTASACGFTPQYDGLEKLYEKYKDQGLVVLGFPCNQFGKQESGSNEEIRGFCTMKFGIQFPMFAKIDVNGDEAHPLFKYLAEEAPGILGSKNIKWNFTKFLVAADGTVVDRFAPTKTPEDIESEIQKLLA